MNKKIERVSSSLEIDEDIDLHIKGWILQRIGWALMVLVLVGAGLGLFGDGILSEKRLAIDGTTVVFERFLRRESDSEIEIISRDENGKVVVTLPPDFHQNYEIERILPEPSRQTIDNSSTIMEFPARGQAHIVFFLVTRKQVTGSIASTVAVNDTEFHLSHYVYP